MRHDCREGCVLSVTCLTPAANSCECRARRHAPVARTQLEEALRDFDPAYVRFGIKTGSALVEHKISA